VPPEEVPDETLERLVRTRQIQIERADVLIVREHLPRLNPASVAALPFRYRVRQRADDLVGHLYSSFQHAASAAHAIAWQQHARLIYLEDDRRFLLADCRPSTTPRSG
jgi:hypothetical protein